jgi:multisubunit Na+/H+ antiporter MnhB subunit
VSCEDAAAPPARRREPARGVVRRGGPRVVHDAPRQEGIERSVPLTAILAITSSGTRRLLEVAAAITAIGGAAVVLAAVDRFRRPGLALAGLLVAIAGVLAVIAFHWGANPFGKK